MLVGEDDETVPGEPPIGTFRNQVTKGQDYPGLKPYDKGIGNSGNMIWDKNTVGVQYLVGGLGHGFYFSMYWE